MGWGDFGSNGSVHWRIHYHDNDKMPGSPPVVSGIDGRKKHPNAPKAPSAAEAARPNIGKEKGSKPEHDRRFRVTGRYETERAALDAVVTTLSNLFENPEQARAAILDALGRIKGNALKPNEPVILDVLVWPAVRPGDGAFNPPEVSVDW